MKRRSMFNALLGVLAASLWPRIGLSGTETSLLPAPGGFSRVTLEEALRRRQTGRSFAARDLSEKMLANLLWAGCGVNRVLSGKRTAPSARNMQEIDVYVAMRNGLFLYHPRRRLLTRILQTDIRAKTGGQEFVAQVPVNLIYVADYSRMTCSATQKEFYAAADTGFISQNVYLFCAGEGLATVVRGMVDREKLHRTMGLSPAQHVVLAQSVGYPG